MIFVEHLLLYSGTTPAIAVFKHHNGPITSVEWHASGLHGAVDSTIFASAGADDQVSKNLISLYNSHGYCDSYILGIWM